MAERQAMHAGEAVAEALHAEGVECIYSVPGSHIHPIYDGISRIKPMRFVTCKMEPNTSLMADAYGRLTGKPGVCLVTAGPGGVNSMAGVAQAYGAASPMVHIGGAVPLKADMEAFHGVDNPAFVHEMFKHITKWSARVERIEDIPEVMAKAFHIARSGRPGPVHVELPRESDESEYVLQKEKVVLPEYKRLPTVVHQPVAADVARFAQRLKAAKSPVIAAGKGVIRQGALAGIIALAEKLQAPVINAQDAIGVIAESHPLFAGYFKTGRSHPACDEAMKNADLVIGIGLRAGTAEMTELNSVTRAPQILIGFDDVQESRYRGDDQRVADPKLFVDALLAELDLLAPRLDDVVAGVDRDVEGLLRSEIRVHPLEGLDRLGIARADRGRGGRAVASLSRGQRDGKQGERCHGGDRPTGVSEHHQNVSSWILGEFPLGKMIPATGTGLTPGPDPVRNSLSRRSPHGAPHTVAVARPRADG